MGDVFGLLAFASLIAAQFLAVVVAYSERFETDPLGGQRSANQREAYEEPLQGAAHTCFADANFPATVPHCTSSHAVGVDAANSAPISVFQP